MSEHWFEAEPLWFKRAVFYEIYVRGFHDGNADGSGDFLGLAEKLDYLQWLGIDCIWLLPMYSSPLRDGGYDISDFFTIQPDYGTVDDVRDFIEASHQRGMRVIADLVMNHTSSDHPWFREARSSPDSPKRDWYVWSDTKERYKDARIIFIDTETSNWTWDEQAGAYYWHRFFHHQPDLNYDNPEVQEAMLDVLRFWLDLGLDGFRLDAVPYLFERDGTNCEILEILDQTPPIPDNCQWGLFLRNHDELTLEMVTDDERDYMYKEYAKDPRMRINLGIRRRLAPLLDNGPRVRLPGPQRRGAAPHALVALALDAPLHRAAQGAPGVRARQLRAAAPGEQADLRPHPPLRARGAAVRAQPRALGAGRGARPFGVRGEPPRGDVRAQPLPAHRRAALPADPGTPWLLLVPAGGRGGGRG